MEKEQGLNIESMKKLAVFPDKGATYDGGVHTINLSEIKPMVAHPGNPNKGIPSDPTNGANISDIGDVKIDIPMEVLVLQVKRTIFLIMLLYVVLLKMQD